MEYKLLANQNQPDYPVAPFPSEFPPKKDQPVYHINDSGKSQKPKSHKSQTSRKSHKLEKITKDTKQPLRRTKTTKHPSTTKPNKRIPNIKVALPIPIQPLFGLTPAFHTFTDQRFLRVSVGEPHVTTSHPVPFKAPSPQAMAT